MSSPKTVPTSASVDAFIEQVGDERRRAECRALAALMQQATGAAPVMWGSAIVGFGAWRMRYENGKEGDWPLIGFSPRKTELTLYIMPGFAELQPLIDRLGKVRTGKSCLYIKRLADVDAGVLKQLVEASVHAMADRRSR